MKIRTKALVLIVGIAFLAAACTGGNSGGSSSVSQSEINAFFDLYGHRISTQNTNALADMYHLPVTFTGEGTSATVEVTERSDLNSVLAGRTYTFDDDWEVDDVNVITSSITGRGSNAEAHVVLTIYSTSYDAYVFEWREIIELKVGLRKVDGNWRIRSEHLIANDFEAVD